MKALSIAATGMQAQQTRVEVISNNLANMSTTGYNPRRAEFTDLHYQTDARAGTVVAADGTEMPAGVQIGLGVRVAAIAMEPRQGALEETGGVLDLAVEGAGYIEVELPDGRSAYTRDGALKRSGEGVLVNSDGYALVPDITVPEDSADIAVNADGEVYAYFRDQVEPELLGRVSLATFVNEKGLDALGGNLYVETPASGAPLTGAPGVDGRGTFRQGYLEGSAVDSVREMTDLIEAQRAYELNAKVVTASDQMLAATTQVR